MAYGLVGGCRCAWFLNVIEYAAGIGGHVLFRDCDNQGLVAFLHFVNSGGFFYGLPPVPGYFPGIADEFPVVKL